VKHIFQKHWLKHFPAQMKTIILFTTTMNLSTVPLVKFGIRLGLTSDPYFRVCLGANYITVVTIKGFFVKKSKFLSKIKMLSKIDFFSQNENFCPK